MAAFGGSTPARRGVCVPRALLTQPPENVNVGRSFLISLLFFILPPPAYPLSSRPLSLSFCPTSRARLEESNLRMTPSAPIISSELCSKYSLSSSLSSSSFSRNVLIAYFFEFKTHLQFRFSSLKLSLDFLKYYAVETFKS